MAIRAYKDTYLNQAAKNFGRMLDYAVNDLNINGSLFLHFFITSGLAEQFERGNSKIIAGMSGVEIASKAIEIVTGIKPDTLPSEFYHRSAEYWVGWVLAQYQWYTAMSFAAILRFLPYNDIFQMYPTLHEADITKFYEVAESIRIRELPHTNLKRYRETAGLSQSQLAEESRVSLRSIQMYEQRKKDVNKAQAMTLARIARVLSCDVESLLEPITETN